MKKVLILIAFFAIAAKASAQAFNPNTFYLENEISDPNNLGSNLKRILSVDYNSEIPVHHNIKFRFIDTLKYLNVTESLNYIKNNCSNKGLTIQNAFSLIYFYERDNRIGDHKLVKRFTLFVVNCGGTLGIIAVCRYPHSNVKKFVILEQKDEMLLSRYSMSQINSLPTNDVEVICAN